VSSGVRRKRPVIVKRRSACVSRLQGGKDFIPITAAAIMLLITIAVAVSEVHRELADGSDWSHELDDPNPRRRAEALDRFSLTTDQWPVPLPCASLVERLRDTAVRDRAHPAVSRVVGAGACIRELIALADRDPSASTRAIIARTLAFVPAPKRGAVLPRLVSWTRSKDSSATGAVVALGQLGDTSDAVRNAIEDAFATGDLDVRREAIEATARTGSISQLLRVSDAANRDTSSEVRAAGIRALISLQNRAEVGRALLAQLRALTGDTAAVVRSAVQDVRRQLNRANQREYR
jgi:hypothetical protein